MSSSPATKTTELTNYVPGSVYQYISRKAENLLQWVSNAEEEGLWLRHRMVWDDRPAYPEDIEFITGLPALAEISGSLEGMVARLRDALEARFDAHPLANQLPHARVLVDAALEAGAAPLEVAKVAARTGALAGVPRAIGWALRPPFEAQRSREIQRVATAAIVLELAQLRSWGEFRSGPDDLVERLGQPRIEHPASGVRAAMEGGMRCEPAFDLCLRETIRESVRLFDRVLAGIDRAPPPGELFGYVPPVEPAVAVQALREALGRSTRDELGLPRSFGSTAESLMYQPVEVVGELLGEALSGRSKTGEPLLQFSLDRGFQLLRAVATLGAERPAPPKRPDPPLALEPVERRPRRPSSRSVGRELRPMPSPEPTSPEDERSSSPRDPIAGPMSLKTAGLLTIIVVALLWLLTRR
jgi:hypothetical protein